MSGSREQILLAACDLLENQGFHATGLNEIIKVSGAPKGSLYYYFPEGKEEIVAELVRMAGQSTAERIRSHLSSSEDPAKAVRAFMETIAYHVEASGFRSGGPLTTVASETATTHDRINLACQEAYNELRAAFHEKLCASGISDPRANALVWTITAAIEGAIILSRTYHSGEPLRQAAAQLEILLNADLRTGGNT